MDTNSTIFIDPTGRKRSPCQMARVFIKKRIVFLLIPLSIALFLLYKVLLYEPQCSLPSNLDYLCNSPLLPANGSEGEVSVEQFRLESLTIVTRHGDRSAIHLFNTKQQTTHTFNCMFSEELLKEIPIVRDFIETMQHFKPLLKSPPFHAYAKMPLLPDLQLCPTGTLTPEGCAQLLRNGLFLQEAYKRHGLSDMDVFVTTSTFTRTFQTAVALLYGLLPHLNLSSVPFTQAQEANLCTNNYPLKCECPATYGAHNTFSCTFLQSWLPHGRPSDESRDLSLRWKMWEVFKFNPQKPNPSPSLIFDFLVSHHCHHQQVADVCLLSNVFTHVNEHGRRMAKNHHYVELARLKMLPLISEISKHIEDASKQHKPSLYLYSGHDTTIEPLLTALGISDGLWPRYSARLVFEHYSSRSSGEHFVRMLYDGSPVTHLFHGCHDDSRFVDEFSLCPVDRLASFVEEESKGYRGKCFRSGVFKQEEKMPKEGAR